MLIYIYNLHFVTLIALVYNSIFGACNQLFALTKVVCKKE